MPASNKKSCRRIGFVRKTGNTWDIENDQRTVHGTHSGPVVALQPQDPWLYARTVASQLWIPNTLALKGEGGTLTRRKIGDSLFTNPTSLERQRVRKKPGQLGRRKWGETYFARELYVPSEVWYVIETCSI